MLFWFLENIIFEDTFKEFGEYLSLIDQHFSDVTFRTFIMKCDNPALKQQLGAGHSAEVNATDI